MGAYVLGIYSAPPAPSIVIERTVEHTRFIDSPGCFEDEVFAVQIDHDPTHGLTWRCESIDDFIVRIMSY